MIGQSIDMIEAQRIECDETGDRVEVEMTMHYLILCQLPKKPSFQIP
jgi:hypothetical protein